jgi:hypothetical protein
MLLALVIAAAFPFYESIAGNALKNKNPTAGLGDGVQ